MSCRHDNHLYLIYIIASRMYRYSAREDSHTRWFAGAVFRSFRQLIAAFGAGRGGESIDATPASTLPSAPRASRPAPRPRWAAKSCEIRLRRTTRYNNAESTEHWWRSCTARSVSEPARAALHENVGEGSPIVPAADRHSVAGPTVRRRREQCAHLGCRETRPESTTVREDHHHHHHQYLEGREAASIQT